MGSVAIRKSRPVMFRESSLSRNLDCGVNDPGKYDDSVVTSSSWVILSLRLLQVHLLAALRVSSTRNLTPFYQPSKEFFGLSTVFSKLYICYQHIACG